MWEIDWTQRTTKQEKSYAQCYVWGRNPSSRKTTSRDWHWVAYRTLRKAGVKWQAQSKDKWQHWEIDWTKIQRIKTNTRVWARNPSSWQKRAREWHWTSWAALKQVGVVWQGKHRQKYPDGRRVGTNGYVVLHRRGMTEEQIALADTLGLWIGKSRGRKYGVKEHQLIAAQMYGKLPYGYVVRHLNGNKADNRPDNLLLGTQLDNRRDHCSAVLEMMKWRQRALIAEGKDLVDVLNEDIGL